MQTCASCQAHFYSAVQYCPYCGMAALAAAAAPAAAAAIAPERAHTGDTYQPAPPPWSGPAKATPTTSQPAASQRATQQPDQSALHHVAFATPPLAEGVYEDRQRIPLPNQDPVAHPAADVPAVRKSRGRWVGIALGIVMLGAVFLYAKNMSGSVEAVCDSAVADGLKALAANNIAGAYGPRARADIVCTGAERKKAQRLKSAIASAEGTASKCERQERSVAQALDDHKLISARRGLDNMASACAVGESAQRLRGKQMQMQGLAAAAQTEARKLLQEKNQADARTVIEQLESLNVEQPGLDGLKRQLNVLSKTSADAVQPAVAPPERAPEPRPVAREAAPAPATMPQPKAAAYANRQPDVSTASRADMAQGFLRDAERALSQQQFDSAKAFIESARRLDPSNARADTVAKMIHDRERQVLQQDTSIR